MTSMKQLIDSFLEEKPEFTSNRIKTSRRSLRDRRTRCASDRIYERRSGEERRVAAERRKRWKRAGQWGAEIDPDSYLKGYHVS